VERTGIEDEDVEWTAGIASMGSNVNFMGLGCVMVLAVG